MLCYVVFLNAFPEKSTPILIVRKNRKGWETGEPRAVFNRIFQPVGGQIYAVWRAAAGIKFLIFQKRKVL